MKAFAPLSPPGDGSHEPAGTGLPSIRNRLGGFDELGFRSVFIILLSIVAGPGIIYLVQLGILAPLPGAVLDLFLLVLLLPYFAERMTRKLRAERALFRASEQRLALATEAYGGGVFQWDAVSGKIIWSAGAEKRLGLPIGSITDFEQWAAHVDPGDLKDFTQSLDKLIASRGERFAFSYRIRTHDGDIRQIETSAKCIYDASGALIGTVGMHIDVTQRDRSEAELRSIIETVPSGMILIDEAGLIIRSNKIAERMFDFQRDDLIGCHITRLLSRDDAYAVQDLLNRYTSGSRFLTVRSSRVQKGLRADGSTFPIELNLGEFKAAGERRFIVFINDVTDRLAAAARIEEMRNEYAHSARLAAMGEIASGLAHELNQPLAAASNFLAAAELSMASPPAPTAEAITQARNELLRAGQIIRRLRDFLSKGQFEGRREALGPMIEDTIALALVGRDRAQLTVKFEVDPRASIIFADRVQVQQVLVNLIRNSAEALIATETAAAQILISSYPFGPDMVQVEIRDNGPGFPSEVLENSHKPFFSTKREGMGVGLSICRRIIEAHGGAFEMSNHVAGGARVTITLPIRGADDR
jgi:two-component system sensor kinase FixL